MLISADFFDFSFGRSKPPLKDRLLLHCDATHSSFILSKHRENWRRTFTDLRTALNFASTVVTEDAALLIYNDSGRVIIETVVSPATAVEDGFDGRKIT
ncbi:MAG TPA: hypothetical protein VGM54_01985 [Chthoniobacter sp.]|jgi:hypothetical protein